ncbi:hypothetical protein GCM10022631_19560 [Deinococcus rubellus]|uniref:Uncharacterized protein n=1 Tax=Deinococcus rubellus TaxID=1889240 RepID=A0ABY5YF95_9DEIO|nr:hypothetical protein [Deinococcus rubellus]UWX63750.1 hypothetical protein N0D28_13600 [Deinococcus rubellus]
MRTQKSKLRGLKMSLSVCLFSAFSLAAASSTTITTPLSITVLAVCFVNGATAQQVQLKCTRNSAPPQDPRTLGGVPDNLRMAGPLVVVAEDQASDGATLYTYATAQGAVSSQDGVWSVDYF